MYSMKQHLDLYLTGHRVRMPLNKYDQARCRFYEAYPNDSFHAWLGTSVDNYTPNGDFYLLNKNQAKKVELLLSPHWRALLRVMRVRSI